MRFTIALIALIYAFATTSASIFGRQPVLPACADSCFLNADFGGCSEFDYFCLCNSEVYRSSTGTCAKASCSASDFLTVEEYAIAVCNSVGVTLTTAAPSSTSRSTNSISTTEATATSATAVAPALTGFGSSGTTSHAHASIIGPVIGGVIGGLALIIGAITAFVFYRKSHRQPPSADGDNEQKFSDSGGANASSHPQTLNTLQYGDTIPVGHPNSDSFSPANLAHFSPTPFNHDNVMPLPPVNIPRPSENDIRASSPAAHVDDTLNRHSLADVSYAQSIATLTEPSSRAVKDLEAQQLALSRSAQPPSSPSSNNGLTSEQLVTVQELYKMNLPASEIAILMERMRSGALAEGEESGGLDVDANLLDSAAPPEYDFKV